MKRAFTNAFTKETPFFFILPAILWQVIFFFIPLAIIIWFSIALLNEQGVWQGFTFQHYAGFFDLVYAKILARSFILALINATCCLFFAYPVAYFVARKIAKRKNFFLFLLTLPFWTNFLIQVYAWFFILERNGLINTLLRKLGIITDPLQLAHSLIAVFIVMLYCYLPFMIMPLYTSLEKLNVDLIEASYDLGATPWQTFYRVTVPLSMPGINTGFVLVFVLSFGEFVIPALLGGAKFMFVGSLISYYFLVARDTFLGSAFTCLGAFVLLFFALAVLSIKRIWRR